jgi:hypothetical protein
MIPINTTIIIVIEYTLTLFGNLEAILLESSCTNSHLLLFHTSLSSLRSLYDAGLLYTEQVAVYISTIARLQEGRRLATSQSVR